MEIRESKLEGLLENPTPSSSKLREKVFVSVLREKKNLQKMGLYIPITFCLNFLPLTYAMLH